MNCPHCRSSSVVKNGKTSFQNGTALQTYLCKSCGSRFNERPGTPMARLRTPTTIVSLAMKMRTEGMGIRASGRVLEKSHSTIIRWEKRLADKQTDWSPPAPVGGDITVEASELYTRACCEPTPPVSLKVGRLTFWSGTAQLFEQGTRTAWKWAIPSQSIPWFTDGERRFAQKLWLKSKHLP